MGPLQTNCYLLIDGGEMAVIDPGDEAQKIIAEIVKTGAVVKYIINTHNHFDHTGANSDLENKFKVGIWANLNEGQKLTVGKSQLRVVKTPGHTPESFCLFGAGFVISGDTLFKDGFGRTDLEGGSNRDMAVSLEKLDRMISQNLMVYPGHGDIFRYRKEMVLEWVNYLK